MIRILSAVGLAMAGWWLVTAPVATAQGGVKESKYPVGKPCVVTLDPASRHAGLEVPNPESGVSIQMTAKGQLVEVTPEWVVLREGTFDNWIPRSRVLMMRVSQ